MRVVLVGGSGFLGQGLRKLLVGEGHDVVVVSRGAPASHHGWSQVSWDAQSLGPWTKVLEGCDVIVHLAGKRVDCRPTQRNVDELIASREGTVKLVGQALQGLDRPPHAWVQLSSLAIYGDSGDHVIDENTAPPLSGPRQQVEVCRRWEAAFDLAAADVPRRVLLRPAIGIGGSGDPATAQLARLARLGLGGSVAGGRRWVSWIVIEDLLDLLHRAVVSTQMAGLYHLAAPTPTTNADLMAAYRRAVGRRFGLPAPAPVVKVGALVLGSDPALALTGRRCVPARLLAEGYQFRCNDLNDAVARAVAAG